MFNMKKHFTSELSVEDRYLPLRRWDNPLKWTSYRPQPISIDPGLRRNLSSSCANAAKQAPWQYLHCALLSCAIRRSGQSRTTLALFSRGNSPDHSRQIIHRAVEVLRSAFGTSASETVRELSPMHTRDCARLPWLHTGAHRPMPAVVHRSFHCLASPIQSSW